MKPGEAAVYSERRAWDDFIIAPRVDRDKVKIVYSHWGCHIRIKF
jgi:hypothetical protein